MKQNRVGLRNFELESTKGRKNIQRKEKRTKVQGRKWL